jgi:hypothetical protein
MVTLEYNLKKINEMYKFEEGWDGYDANPISKEILDLTKSLLKRIKMQPEVFPVATGGIQLEYEKGNNYLEIELCENSLSLFMINEKDKDSFSIKSYYEFRGINSISDYINLLIEEYVKEW